VTRGEYPPSAAQSGIEAVDWHRFVVQLARHRRIRIEALVEETRLARAMGPVAAAVIRRAATQIAEACQAAAAPHHELARPARVEMEKKS